MDGFERNLRLRDGNGADVRASLVLRALLVGLLLLVATHAVSGRAAAAAADAAPRAAASCDGSSALSGSFVQLTRVAALRPRAEWETLFTDMAAVGVEQVFVQWTRADGVAFYAADEPGADDVPIVDTLLELATRHGMRVWLGLEHDAGWWAGIDRNRPAEQVEVFLARRRIANLAVARALAPRVAAHAAFAGWYVPDEIDDKNWLGAGRAELLTAYLTDLGTELATLAPGAPVAVSGFAQGWATPEQVSALWTAIATRSPVRMVLFQDGVGAGKLTLTELPIYLPLLRKVTDGAGKELGIVVELFTQAPAGPGTAPSFSAVPAPLARVERQLALEQPWASGPVVAFSVPDYMSPFGGAPAGELYGAYRDWVARCRSTATR